MNPATGRSPAPESCPPQLGGTLAPLKAIPERGHFPFQRLTRHSVSRSRLSQIFFRARCWLLTQEVALRVWWRG